MSCHPRTKLIVAVEDLEDSGREELLSQLAQLQATVRSKGGRLQDDRVSRQQCRSYLLGTQRNGKVPWDDQSADSKRGIRQESSTSLVFVPGHLRQVQVAQFSRPQDGHLDLSLGQRELVPSAKDMTRLWKNLTDRLPLLERQQTSESFGVGLQSIGKLIHQCLSSLDRNLRPFRKGRPGTTDSLIQIFRRCDWDLWKLFHAGWVRAMACPRAPPPFPVDHIIKSPGRVEACALNGGHGAILIYDVDLITELYVGLVQRTRRSLGVSELYPHPGKGHKFRSVVWNGPLFLPSFLNITSGALALDPLHELWVSPKSRLGTKPVSLWCAMQGDVLTTY